MTRSRACMLACAFALVSACGGDDSGDGGMSGQNGNAGYDGAAGFAGFGGMTGGSAGSAGGGIGGSGAMGGTAGTADSGAGGQDAGEGGTGGMNDAGMIGGDGGDSGDGGDAGGAGTDGGNNEGPLFDRACTAEVPWECRVCEDQTTCDAPTYEDNGDGTVSSSCCGLVWQRDTEWMIEGGDEFDSCLDRPGADGCYDFEAAAAYCTGLTLAGGGWRVPEPIELESLILRDRATSPYIDTTAFPSAPLWDLYWSSMTSAENVNEAWLAGFGGTPAALRQKSTAHFVRCVKAE